jgi:hypothetical protein
MDLKELKELIVKLLGKFSVGLDLRDIVVFTDSTWSDAGKALSELVTEGNVTGEGRDKNYTIYRLA